MTNVLYDSYADLVVGVAPGGRPGPRRRRTQLPLPRVLRRAPLITPQRDPLNDLFGRASQGLSAVAQPYYMTNKAGNPYLTRAVPLSRRE